MRFVPFSRLSVLYWVKAITLSCACLFAPIAAQAGSYVWSDSTTGAKSPTYSGGTSAGNCIYGPFSRNYALGAGDGTYYGDGNGNEYIYSPPGQLSHQSCTGQITATFTWKADDPSDLPPKSVVVEQDCIAGGRVDGGGTFSCDDGLGQSGSVGVSGTKYSIITDPGPQFSVTCNPSASFSHTDSTTANGGSAYVDYKASAYPVTITLRGVTQDASGGDNILIGQNCVAILNIPDLPNTTAGFPNWTIPGHVYTRFDISQDQTSGHAVPYPDPALSQLPSVPEFYWTDGDPISGSEKTIAASADLLYLNPDGTTGGTIGTMTAEKSVTVWTPAVYDDPFGQANPLIGTTAIDLSTTPGAVITVPADNAVGGFEFDAAVGTPPLFPTYGNWAWLQLCKLNVTQGGTGDQMNTYQLDSAFPYNTGAGVGDVPGNTWDANSTAERQNYDFFTDSPEEGWNGTDTALAFNNSYRLYLMFYPPENGEGVNWVPLYSYDWGFQASITRSNILSSDWTPNPPGSLSYSGSQSNPDYPDWDDKHNSGS